MTDSGIFLFFLVLNRKDRNGLWRHLGGECTVFEEGGEAVFYFSGAEVVFLGDGD